MPTKTPNKTRTRYIVPMNRVEGDLEIQLEIKDGRVEEAYSIGTMYRGFENIMKGRAALDSLVITPRICGICSTAHLNTAAKALDMIFEADVPDNGKRVRNITLMVERIQSDIRHAFLIFMPDFTNAAYQKNPLYGEAVKRYQPLVGETAMQSIVETKKILEIVAVLGGQWPHSSFMVPGGVLSLMSPADIIQCRHILSKFRSWYENRVLGCSIERWEDIQSEKDLNHWLDESRKHHGSDLGFFIRFSRSLKLDKIGRGHGNFISFGSFDMPGETAVKSLGGGQFFLPGGFAQGTEICMPDQAKIEEDIQYSWFSGYSKIRHPYEGITVPYATGREGEKYTWSKAPRYDGKPAETGPLAEMIAARIPLFTDMIESYGPNVFVRELARLVRPAMMFAAIETWLKEIAEQPHNFYSDYKQKENGEGFGLVQASRGTLGHWIKIEDDKIENYQIITPTAWNASPRDSEGVRGPWEEALVGLPLKDPDNAIEAEIVVRSFDACMVCCVHTICVE